MSDEVWIVIPKWEEFQHYKDRSPTWIKNYTRLLSDDAYLNLTYAQRGLLHGIWILRASANEAPTSTRTKHLLTTNKAEARHFRNNLEALNHAGFITFSASKPLATPYQTASPEKRREERTTRTRATPKTPQHICPICTLECRHQRELTDHLDNVHGIEPGGTP
jgi:hypothetical protein